MLTDVLAVGRRVRLAGLDDRALVGKMVLLLAGGRTVARTTVRRDGSFATTTGRRSSRRCASRLASVGCAHGR